MSLLKFKYTSFISDVQEYCRFEDMNVTCSASHVVLMTSARYGRMRMGRCLNRDYYVGCGGDFLKQLDAR